MLPTARWRASKYDNKSAGDTAWPQGEAASIADVSTGDAAWPQGEACVASWWADWRQCLTARPGVRQKLTTVVTYDCLAERSDVCRKSHGFWFQNSLAGGGVQCAPSQADSCRQHLEAWAAAGWQMVWGNPRRFAQALQVWSPGRKGGRLQRSASTWACPVGTAMWVPAEFKYGAVLRGRSSIGNRTASRGLFGRVRPPSVLAVPFRLPDRKVKQRATRKRGLPCRPLRTT